MSARFGNPATVSARRCSEILGIDAGLFHRTSQREGFPFVGPSNRRRFIVEDVRAWWDANIRKKKDLPESGASPAAAAEAKPSAARASLAKEDDPFIQEMMSGRASPLAINRAAMQMASRRVAMAAVAGTLSANDLDGLKKTLAELRAAEADYIELERDKGNLIDLAAVKGVVATMAQKLIRAFTNLENSIGTEALQWRSMTALTSEQLSRQAREFVSKHGRELRRAEAEGAEAMLVAGEE